MPSQRGVDAVDLTNRTLLPGRGAVDESDAEALDQLCLQVGVVPLRGGDFRLVEHASVQGEPATVVGLHLVRDRDMGMEVRVASTGVAVGEGGRDETADGHLANAGTAGARERDLALQPGDRVLDRRCVGGFDLAGDVGGSKGPQHRDGLDRREGEVVAGDRLGELSRLDRQEPGQLPFVVRRSTMLIVKPGRGDLGTDAGPLLGGDRGAPVAAACDVVLGEGLGDNGLERGCPQSR